MKEMCHLYRKVAGRTMKFFGTHSVNKHCVNNSQPPTNEVTHDSFPHRVYRSRSCTLDAEGLIPPPAVRNLASLLVLYVSDEVVILADVVVLVEQL